METRTATAPGSSNDEANPPPGDGAKPAESAPRGKKKPASKGKKKPGPKGDGAPVERIRVVGFWWRFVAALVDLIIIAMPVGIWALAIADHFPDVKVHDIDYIAEMILRGDPVLRTSMMVVPLFAVLYFTATTGFLGTSPGKWLLRLRVVDRRGRPAGLLRSALRSFLYLLDVALFCAGFFWVAFDRKKRGLHDLLAGTLVVRRRRG